MKHLLLVPFLFTLTFLMGCSNIETKNKELCLKNDKYITLFGDGINYKKQVKILGLHSGKNISNYEASKLVKNYCSNLKNFS
tara:strand:- start:153 stop:398 length:246 start_codon:yes stop_codon:yes gene_type:complete